MSIEALKAFIDDNEDIEQLETILDRFNLFASLGLVRQEIRHSAFVRCLLDPSETHGLGDYWLRQFLRRVIKDGEGNQDDFPSLFDLDDWGLGRVEVRKEWHNIDLLILDEDNKFVCAIENKVDAVEHSGQLQRYRRIVNENFGEYQKAFVFLTISGEAPSDETYVPMSYGEIASIIENALRRRESQVNDEIRLFIQQYLDMVRRYIVEEPDVQELCRRLYQNHRRALDLIFDHRPDRAAEVSLVIRDYISSRNDLILQQGNKTYIHFLPSCVDVLPHEGTQFESKRMLHCLLQNKDKRVGFKLEMGPGPQHIREQVCEKAKSLPKVFGKAKSKLSPTYHSFFTSNTWINVKEYDELNNEEIRQRVSERIDAFIESKGKVVADALKELTDDF